MGSPSQWLSIGVTAQSDITLETKQQQKVSYNRAITFLKKKRRSQAASLHGR